MKEEIYMRHDSKSEGASKGTEYMAWSSCSMTNGDKWIVDSRDSEFYEI